MVNQLVSEARAARDQVQNPRETIGGNNPPKVHELLITELQDTYKLELEKIAPIATRANAAPQKIESDDDLKLWTNIYLDADTLFKSLDGSRLNEQRPLLQALKTVFGPTLERLERITVFAKKLSDDFNRAKIAKERAEREAEQKRLRDEAEAAARDAQIAAEFGNTDDMVEHAQAAAASQVEAARLQADTPAIADVARVRADDGGGMATAKGEWKFEILDIQKVDLNALRAHFPIKEIEKAIGKAVRATKQHTKIDGVRVYEDVATQFRR